MKITGKILKYLFAFLSLFGIIGFGRELTNAFLRLMDSSGPIYFFFAGMVAFTLLWMFFLSHRGNFWSTLEHELTHALFAIIFLKRINSISATRKKGGVIAIEGGNAVIALSPYFFPLAASIVLLIKFVIPQPYHVYMIFLLGFTYQFHIINLIREFHMGQSDLHLAGPVFSIIFILFANILFLGIFLVSLKGNWKDVGFYLWNGLQGSWNFLEETWRLISGSP